MKKAPNRRTLRRKDRAPRFSWSPATRVLVIGLMLGLGASLVIARAFELQIHSHERYAGAKERQSTTSRRVTAKRGVIKDRHGAELAISVDVDSIYAEPHRIEDPAAVAAKLAPILGVPAKKLIEKLTTKAYFKYLRRRVAPEIAGKVRALGVAGVGISAEPKRFYSNRALGAHVLGFTNDEGIGVAGVERAFDDVLRGRSYEVPSLRDALGNTVLADGFVPQAVLEGDDVVLTLDRHIQHTAEVELANAVRLNQGQAGVAIVMVPRTGDILALASYPEFNPNNLRGTTAREHLNRAVSAVYEPGSTMKLVTIAGALEDGVVAADDKVDCESGKWKVGRRTIRDSDHEYGLLTVGDVLKLSSNICSAKIGMKLGRERLHHWLYAFGFGEKTGTELPGELRGLIRPHPQWRDIALANISFGQGLSVTALQLAQAASVVANGGVLVRPHIIDSIVDKAGRRTTPERASPERVLTKETAGTLVRMMEEVTREGGTATGAAIPGFSVAGKTGTAQKIDPVTRAYSHSLYVASFVGFAPADDPKVVVLVLVDEPKKSIYGGIVSAPAFRSIATAALWSLEVYPDDPAGREAFLAAALAASPLPTPEAPGSKLDVDSDELDLESGLSEDARDLLGLSLGLAVVESPDNPARGTANGQPEGWDSGAAADVGADAGRFRMPNFAGLVPREVIHRSAEAKCDFVLLGTGRVVKQSPSPGVLVGDGARCELTLAPNG